MSCLKYLTSIERWRQVVYASPHRLNLQILCTHGTPVRDNLGIWPAFPILIDYRYSTSGITPNDEDNVIAALEHPDRVSYLELYATGSQLEKMATVMQEPFPGLTRLAIFLEDGNTPVLPTKYLGGFSPCLRTIYLVGIPFPALPTLLLSTSDLVKLDLRKIPLTGYISPKAMIVCLAALPRLETIAIEFQSANSRPNRIRPFPVSRIVLPVLTTFRFRGASEYLEDLVAHIDSPQLERILITYFNQLVDFQVAQLSKLIDRSLVPKLTLTSSRFLLVYFSGTHVDFIVRCDGKLASTTIVSCEGIDWQVSHISQVLSQFSTALSNLVHLHLGAAGPFQPVAVGTDDVEWLHLLYQFSAVQTLRLSQTIAWPIALTLEGIMGETVAQVLPSLALIYLEGQPASSIEKFVTARRLSGRPVTVVGSRFVYEEKLESYVNK